jgi:hypothetical protein
VAYTLSTAADTPILCVFNLGNAARSSVAVTVPTSGTASTVIGSAGVTVASDTLTVLNLGPHAFRVYALGTSSATNLYPYENTESVAATMYLRGTMNGWGATLMTEGTNASGDEVWSAAMSLSADTTYQFKFEKDGKTSWGDHWGAASPNADSALVSVGSNIAYRTGIAGVYTFTFNRTRLQWGVSAP